MDFKVLSRTLEDHKGHFSTVWFVASDTGLCRRARIMEGIIFSYQRLCENDLLHILRFECGWDTKISPPSHAYPAPFHIFATLLYKMYTW